MSATVKVVDQGGWGVCGFVSVLNAMAQDDKLPAFYKVSMDDMQKRLAPELITWLKVKNVEQPQIVRDILTFSKEFKRDYATVDDLVRIIKSEFLAGRGTEGKKMGTALDIAMPPHCLVQYLHDAFRRQ